MGVKTVLLSIIVAHMFTAIFNESSISNFSQTEEKPPEGFNPDDPETGTDNKGIRSFYAFTPNSEDNFEKKMTFNSRANRMNRGSQRGSESLEILNVSRSDCNQTIVQTDSVTFAISNETVLFLKGLLVTRIMPYFYIFLLISIPLNTLALVTFTCRIQAKKPAVIFMSHLACVDLLFALLLPLKIHYHLNGSNWVFGEVACRVVSAAYYCYMYCSILLMMCMSVDRLLAVVFPVASLYWRNIRKATGICVVIWLLAIAGTVPLLSIKLTFRIKDVGITCHDVLPYKQQHVYLFLFSILSSLYFVLPLVITLVSYSAIIYVLSAQSAHLTTSPSNKRRRAVIMAIAVVTEFVACFASTNGILLYHCIHLATGVADLSYAAYMLAVCAGSSSVLLDPLLYYYGSSQCRQKISSGFWWRKKKRTTTLSNTLSVTVAGRALKV